MFSAKLRPSPAKVWQVSQNVADSVLFLEDVHAFTEGALQADTAAGDDVPCRCLGIIFADGGDNQRLVLVELRGNLHAVVVDGRMVMPGQCVIHTVGLPVDDGKFGRADVLQELWLHGRIAAVWQDLAETLASGGTGPDGRPPGDVVAAHDGRDAVLQEEFRFLHVAGSVDDVHDFIPTNRALARLAEDIDDASPGCHRSLNVT